MKIDEPDTPFAYLEKEGLEEGEDSMRSESPAGVLREGDGARGGSASPPSAPRPQVTPLLTLVCLCKSCSIQLQGNCNLCPCAGSFRRSLGYPRDYHAQAPPQDLSSQWAALEGKLECVAQEAEAGELVVGAEKNSTQHKKKDFKVRSFCPCVFLGWRSVLALNCRGHVRRTSARRTTTSFRG
jgi:hypothetical protein